MTRVKLFIVLFIFLSTVTAQNYLDVVTLKNGDVIKGKIVENVINDHIRIELAGGSILTFKYDQIEKLEAEKTSTRTFRNGIQKPSPNVTPTQIRDCYNDGYISGQRISGGGPMLGGFVGGVGLGLIGWGISYAIVASGNPQPSYAETQNLDATCKVDYMQGYKEGAQKVRKSSVHIGGALGTLVILVLLSGG